MWGGGGGGGEGGGGGSTGLFPAGPGFGKHIPCLAPRHSPQVGAAQPTGCWDRNSERQLWSPRHTETPRRQLEAAREALVRAGEPQSPAGQASNSPRAGGRGQHSTRHRGDHREGPELTWPPTVLRGDGCYQRCYQGGPMAATGLRGGYQHPKNSRLVRALTCQ